MQILSILIAASAGVFYHISQKCIPAKSNPALSMMVTFTVALIGTIMWYFFKGSSNSLYADMKNIHWASVSLGLSIIGLEFGILLAYRAGWKISNFNLFYTFLLAVMLLPVGVFFFKESVSIRSIVGMSVTVLGILLMKA